MANVWWWVSIGAAVGAVACTATVIYLVRDFRRWWSLTEKL
ncbi:MAG TPA: hypothetical protein VFG38_20100 [Pseudomonadales bacterium]|nr:hypothetical protein [Pseudomonadales bacterium]